MAIKQLLLRISQFVNKIPGNKFRLNKLSQKFMLLFIVVLVCMSFTLGTITYFSMKSSLESQMKLFSEAKIKEIESSYSSRVLTEKISQTSLSEQAISMGLLVREVIHNNASLNSEINNSLLARLTLNLSLKEISIVGSDGKVLFSNKKQKI
ncbi:MAG: hypothetical protein GX660_21770, partial [Clostridiaceae bacterium]|nr:hypothetical protein [Clostridiaceae bacterium]